MGLREKYLLEFELADSEEVLEAEIKEMLEEMMRVL